MFAYVVVVLLVLWRLALPYTHNPLFDFTPETAALLYFGSRQPRKWMWVPVALMAVGDIILNAHYGYGLKADILVTWAWYAAAVWLGSLLRQHQSFLRVTGAAIGGSLSFFVVSNFMVWVSWPEMYPERNLHGIVQCLAAGVPFYRNRFAGDLVFTAVLFGVPALVRMMQGEHADHQLPAA